jgi:hypothetical protein
VSIGANDLIKAWFMLTQCNQMVPGLGSIGGDGDVSALSLMANGFRDIATGSAVTPYLGGRRSEGKTAATDPPGLIDIGAM